MVDEESESVAMFVGLVCHVSRCD